MTLSASVLLYRSSLSQQDIEHVNKNTISASNSPTVRNIPCVQLHPVLQLLSDVLVLPLGQVGDDDTGVKATRVGSHPQLLNSLFLEVQETYIIILLEGKWGLLFQDEKIDIL